MFDLLADNTILQGSQYQYRILAVIGRGGMGAVYRGERLPDGSIWAVKEMRPPADASPEEVAENRKLFVQEAAMLRALNHPNLPQVIDDFEQGGRPYLVMEFVQGKTLEDKQREINAPFFQNDVINWGVQIARVLHYLHTRNPPIIFRDMKPPNVMLTPEGVIKLIDFGVARTYKAQKSKDTVAMGSAGYAPPEQYGKGQTDARADIYALGATLFHLLTNIPPIPLQTPRDGAVIRHNQSVSVTLEQVIIRAMAMDREKRYQTMQELEQALLQSADGPLAIPAAAQPGPNLVWNQAPQASVPSVQPQPQPQPAPQPQWGQPAQPTPKQQWTPPPPWGQPSQPVQPAQPVSPWTAPPTGPICDQCGRLNKETARFCTGCGSSIKQAVGKLIITSPRAVWEMPLLHLPCRIGRRDPAQNHHPEIDLAEHDRGVASRRHATIDRHGDAYHLVDLGSVNGTRLNGLPMRPHEPYTLRQGDRINIGDVEMVFNIE